MVIYLCMCINVCMSCLIDECIYTICIYCMCKYITYPPPLTRPVQWCYSQHNVHYGLHHHNCHMCSLWTSSHLWREQCTNGGSTSSSVLWYNQAAQCLAMNTGHTNSLVRKHAHQCGLAQCSSCLSLHKDIWMCHLERYLCNLNGL